LLSLAEKLISYIEKFDKTVDVLTNTKFIIYSFNVIHLLIDNCMTTLYSILPRISQILLKFENIEHLEIRYHIGKCWLVIIKNDDELFQKHLISIFDFFVGNTQVIHYNMNFAACEFFLNLFDHDKEEIPNKKVNELLFNKLKQILPKIFEFIKLSNNDLCSIESGENKLSKVQKDEKENPDDEDSLTENDGYNVNWTLRKCGSKFLDKLSFVYKDYIVDIMKNSLEEGIQSKNWRTKYFIWFT